MSATGSLNALGLFLVERHYTYQHRWACTLVLRSFQFVSNTLSLDWNFNFEAFAETIRPMLKTHASIYPARLTSMIGHMHLILARCTCSCSITWSFWPDDLRCFPQNTYQTCGGQGISQPPFETDTWYAGGVVFLSLISSPVPNRRQSWGVRSVSLSNMLTVGTFCSLRL